MIYLASASPRRQQLIKQITSDFETVPADVDEVKGGGLSDTETARHNATLKARHVFAQKKGIVIGADTVVSIGGELLGKPENAEAAKQMLQKLSGRAHRVITAVCVISDLGEFTDSEISVVRFNTLSPEVIESYVCQGYSFGKAGAYGIQDNDFFVKSLQGSRDNVIGLPVSLTKKLLNKAGYRG